MPELVSAADHILLVSRKGQAIRFPATDDQLRPMGRATSGVTGMKCGDGDAVLSMSVIRAATIAAFRNPWRCSKPRGRFPPRYGSNCAPCSRWMR